MRTKKNEKTRAVSNAMVVTKQPASALITKINPSMIPYSKGENTFPVKTEYIAQPIHTKNNDSMIALIRNPDSNFSFEIGANVIDNIAFL